MQVKAITVNVAGTTAAKRSIQGNGALGVNHVKTENGNVFAPECKVTISREGRDLSRRLAEKDIMQKAVDADLGMARRDGLNGTSRELADEVRKLIDERNDVDRILQDKEEEKEEQPEQVEGRERAGLQEKLLQSKEQDRGSM